MGRRKLQFKEKGALQRRFWDSQDSPAKIKPKELGFETGDSPYYRVWHVS